MVERVGWTKFGWRDGYLRCPNGENVARTFLDLPGSHAATQRLRDALPVARRCACQRITVEAQRQAARLLPDNSDRHQLQPRAVYANPPKEVDPSMLASFSSMGSESDIKPGENAPPIQSGRKPL